ncbi:MAG: YlmC/YmxH family sporulation protein [Oscillospiraceae bacterium]|nr:YlmC/YmxH family sporulation protein [Oscillospiraceae bacterium]
MLCRFSEFRYKEVINVRTGTRLGYVCDAEFGSPEGRITALIVPGKARYFGLVGREDDYVLPWECISRIGDDIILVESDHAIRRGKRPKKPWFQ